ncbi:MAG: 5'/3'-nucleotidase SurE [Methermicoccaceae archaeon]
MGVLLDEGVEEIGQVESKVSHSRKQILLTNDDGVYSNGILRAFDALKSLGDVTIVAPMLQRSAFGRSISMFEPLRMNEISLAGNRAYAVGGTPADCVILARFSLLKQAPHLVVAGINIGENVSTDSAMTSGTLGAAFEAAGNGSPSVAISVQVDEEGDKLGDGREYSEMLDVCGTILQRASKRLLRVGLPEGVDVLNINVPSGATEDTEVLVTKLARKVFDTAVEERYDPRGRPYYWISGDVVDGGEVGTDCWAIYVKKSISVTPLSLNMSVNVDSEDVLKLFD